MNNGIKKENGNHDEKLEALMRGMEWKYWWNNVENSKEQMEVKTY